MILFSHECSITVSVTPGQALTPGILGSFSSIKLEEKHAVRSAVRSLIAVFRINLSIENISL
jgi:hypothetical protein